MHHIHHRQALVSRKGTGDINQEPFIARDYPTASAYISMAEFVLRNKYPERGRWVNESVTMLVHVSGGRGTFEVEGKKIEVEAGDVVQIDPTERHSFDTPSQLVLVIAYCPAWTREQCQNVE